MDAQLPAPIEQNIQYFSGRAWLLPLLQDWLQKGSERLLLLTGGPGTGKSMIMAWLAGYGPLPAGVEARAQLAALRKQAAAAHFLQANSRNTTPLAFSATIANQLSDTLDGFDEALTQAVKLHGLNINVFQSVEEAKKTATIIGVKIGRINLAGLANHDPFDLGIVQPLKQLYQNGYERPLLLLVDALDEAYADVGGRELVTLLSGLADLPEQIRIIATSRPDPRVTKYFHHAKTVDLIDDAPGDSADIYDFVYDWLRQRNQLNESDARELAKRIDQAAVGIFLYAYMVLRDIVPQLQLPLTDDKFQFPVGLRGLYQDFFNREIGKDEDRWFDELRPLFGLIAVAQGEGLTRQRLRAVLGYDPTKNLRLCDQYLSGPLNEGPFRLFHQSLADYLLADEANIDYEIDAAEMHGRFAKHYDLRVSDWGSIDAYFLHYLPVHLAGAGREKELQRLLLDFSYLQVKLGASSIVALVEDFNNLSTTDRQNPARLVQSALQLSASVLAIDANQLAGQLNGRLQGIDSPEIANLLQQVEAWRGAAWLCPLQAYLTPPGGPLFRVIKGRAGGHAGTVRSAAITHDGKWAITAENSSIDRSIHVWNLATGALQHILIGQAEAGSVTPLAMTPAAAHAVSAYGGEVRLWDLQQGRMTATYEFTDSVLLSLALSADAGMVIAGAADGSLHLWRPAEAAVFQLAGQGEPVNTVALSRDGRLACALTETTLRCWDLPAAELVCSAPIESGARYTIWNPPPLVFAAVGGAVLFGSPLQKLALDGGHLTTLLPEAADEEFLSIASDGKRVLSTDRDGLVSVWDVPNGKRIMSLPRPETQLSVAALSGDGKWVITADYEHDLRIWDVSDEAAAAAHKVTAAELGFVDFLDGSRLGIFETREGSFVVRAFDDGPSPLDLAQQKMLVDEWASSKRGSAVLHKQIADALWPQENDPSLLKPNLSRQLLRISEEGTRAVSIEKMVIKASDREEPLKPHHAPDSAEITLWELSEHPEPVLLKGHSAPLSDIQITPDGRYAISGGWGRIVRVWDLDAAAQRWALPGHQGLVFAVAITPDGRWAASCAEDNTVRLWDLTTGQPAATYSSDTTLVDCRLAADGRLIVAQERSQSTRKKFQYLRVMR